MAVLLIILSVIANMYADMLLFSGKDYANPQQSEAEAWAATPERNIIKAGAIGTAAIGFWVIPAYYLAKLSGTAAMLAAVSLAAFVAASAAFHIAFVYLCLCAKRQPQTAQADKKQLAPYGMVCVFWSLVCTGALLYADWTGVLDLQYWHYPALPLFSMIIIQFGLGTLLKRVPYFADAAGTLAVGVSLLAIMNAVGQL